MLWVVAASLIAFLVLPPLVALVEKSVQRPGPRPVAFWTLARAIGGVCHVPWGRRGSPVVRFSLPDGEGRVRTEWSTARRAWVVEARAYQRLPFSFAARICAPPAVPARWRAPGLAPIDVGPEELTEMPHSSLESNDERLLRWLIRHPETRRMIDDLKDATQAGETELVLAGQVVLVRAAGTPGVGPGQSLEMLALPLIHLLRQLSADLGDLAHALEDSGDILIDRGGCPGCGAHVGEDPWVCPSCRTVVHRGCRETLDGCANPACNLAADALPTPWRPPEVESDGESDDDGSEGDGSEAEPQSALALRTADV
jgi:hypothetical protein